MLEKQVTPFFFFVITEGWLVSCGRLGYIHWQRNKQFQKGKNIFTQVKQNAIIIRNNECKKA